MISIKLQPVTLPPVTDDERKDFARIDTAYGRDALAARIEADIDEWCKQAFNDGWRTHMGASIIGHDCERYIWFSFRWMFKEVFTGRMQRLFDRGHREEHRIIQWLEGIGFTIHQVTEDGKQYRIAFAEGHGGGSQDGVGILPTRYGNNFPPMLLEFKTQKDKKFDILVGSGMQKDKPQHFVQASIYGRKNGLRYCLYIAVNKETDELDVEVIELDWGLADAELAKAEKIINLQYAPPRLSENPSFWKCRYCPALAICHHGAPVTVNCRSCRHAEAMPNKAWQCNLFNGIIPVDFIAKGCSSYEALPK